MAKRIEVHAQRLLASGGSSKAETLEAPVFQSDATGVTIAPDKSFVIRSSLSLPGIPDVLAAASNVRYQTPVLDGVLDDSYDLRPLPLSKFVPTDVLPVPLGGTGNSSLPEGQLIVGDGDQPLLPVPEVTFQGDAVNVIGALRLNEFDGTGASTGQAATIYSDFDAVGNPALFLQKPDGEVLNILAPNQSLKPEVTGTLPGTLDPETGARAFQVSFQAYLPRLLTASAFLGAGSESKTASEVAQAYRADATASEPMSHAPATATGFPSRDTYTQEVSLTLPTGFTGAVFFVVTDAWGNVSDPFAILQT